MIRNVALRGNTGKIYLLAVLMGGLQLAVPTLNLFWAKECGLTLVEVMALEAVFSLAMVLLDVPTGYFADLAGRRRAIVCGALLSTVAELMYWQAHGFATALAAELVLALGTGLLSGADQALLYDSLAAQGQSRRFVRVMQIKMALWMGASGVFAIIGGALAASDLRLPLLVAGGMSLAGVLVALSLAEAPHDSSLGKPPGLKLRAVVRENLADGPVRWLILYPALVSAGSMSVFWLYQPYFIEAQIAPQMFGWIYAAMNWTAALSAFAVNREDPRREWVLIIPAVSGVCFALMGFLVSPWSIGFLLVHAVVRGGANVLFPALLNVEIGSQRRATVVSMQSTAFRIFSSVLFLPVGFLAEHASTSMALGVMGAFSIAVAFGGYLACHGRPAGEPASA